MGIVFSYLYNPTHNHAQGNEAPPNAPPFYTINALSNRLWSMLEAVGGYAPGLEREFPRANGSPANRIPSDLMARVERAAEIEYQRVNNGPPIYLISHLVGQGQGELPVSRPEFDATIARLKSLPLGQTDWLNSEIANVSMNTNFRINAGSQSIAKNVEKKLAEVNDCLQTICRLAIYISKNSPPMDFLVLAQELVKNLSNQINRLSREISTLCATNNAMKMWWNGSSNLAANRFDVASLNLEELNFIGPKGVVRGCIPTILQYDSTSNKFTEIYYRIYLSDYMRSADGSDAICFKKTYIFLDENDRCYIKKEPGETLGWNVNINTSKYPKYYYFDKNDPAKLYVDKQNSNEAGDSKLMFAKQGLIFFMSSDEDIIFSGEFNKTSDYNMDLEDATELNAKKLFSKHMSDIKKDRALHSRAPNNVLTETSWHYKATENPVELAGAALMHVTSLMRSLEVSRTAPV